MEMLILLMSLSSGKINVYVLRVCVFRELLLYCSVTFDSLDSLYQIHFLVVMIRFEYYFVPTE